VNDEESGGKGLLFTDYSNEFYPFVDDELDVDVLERLRPASRGTCEGPARGKCRPSWKHGTS
jgi:hypothetical protein